MRKRAPAGRARDGAGPRPQGSFGAMETHNGGRRISVVVADDHPLYRDGLVRAISSVPELVLVGEAADGLEAELLIDELRPDVVLLDVKMPGLGGVELC